MALVRRADPVDLLLPGAGEGSRAASRGRLRRWLPIGIGLAMAVIMIVVAAAAPLIAPLSPSAQFSDSVLKGPGAIERHLLGTDEFGRDILSRIIWGARVSLEVGLASVLFAFVLGVPLGIVAGVRGGRVDTAIMRCACRCGPVRGRSPKHCEPIPGRKSGPGTGAWPISIRTRASAATGKKARGRSSDSGTGTGDT